jgi:hypothetical protein
MRVFGLSTLKWCDGVSAANDAEVLTWMDQCIEASKADDQHVRF